MTLSARAQALVEGDRRVPELAHRVFGRFSSVSTDPFLDPAQFAWTSLLERSYPAVRAEAERVLRVRDALPNFQDIAPDQITLSADEQWKTFWFLGMGIWDEPGCRRCPETAAVLRQIPGLTTAFFSILGPGKTLPPHHGPYRGVLRAHLALIVPEPRRACVMRVAGQERHWEEGRVMVFDDTPLHSAENGTDGERVVLFLDVKRPLRPPVDKVNDLVLAAVARSPFVKRARAQHVAREPQFAAAWDATFGESAPDSSQAT